jgi:hypothetical protein
MMYSLLYEPNDGSMVLGFCVFLRFFTVCNCVLWLSVNKMFGIASKGMGIFKLCVGCLLGQRSFMMGLSRIIRKQWWNMDLH